MAKETLHPLEVPKRPAKRECVLDLGDSFVTFYYRKANLDTNLAFVAYYEELTKKAEESRKDLVENGVGVDHPISKRPTYDRHMLYRDLLRFILCEKNAGDLERITDVDIDLVESEVIIQNFAPESMRILATLMGF